MTQILRREVMNKTQQVLQHLKTHTNGITSWEAIQLFKATRLSAIIFNLKKEGHIINSKEERKNNEHWTRYYLETRNTLEIPGGPQGKFEGLETKKNFFQRLWDNP